MGYDLCGIGKHFVSMNVWTWSMTLQYAYNEGWEPAGTVFDHDIVRLQIGTEAPPEERARIVAEVSEDRSGSYFFNDWQRVTDADAAALGRAVEQVLARSVNCDPNFDESCADFETAIGRWETDLEECCRRREYHVSPHQRTTLEKFAALCRAGGFMIG